jgi:hypothetical protein
MREASLISLIEGAPLGKRSAESWLRMQMTHDLWRAQKTRLPKIRPLERGRSSKDVGTLAKFFADSPLRPSGLKVKRAREWG